MHTLTRNPDTLTITSALTPGASARVTFTALHDETTVAGNALAAVTQWALALLYDDLAGLLTVSDPAGAAGYQAKADGARAQYQTLLGVSAGELEWLDSYFDQAAGLVTDTMRTEAITSALLKLSADAPRAVIEDIDTPALPDAWSGANSVRSVEYPVGYVPPEYIQAHVYPGPAGVYQLYTSLAAGTTVRLTYTAPWTLGLVTGIQREALACWAAGLICEQLATRFAQDTDSTIQADSVMHESKSRNFAARAKSLRARYYELLGLIDPDKRPTAAACAVVNLDMNTGRGYDRFYHPRAWR